MMILFFILLFQSPIEADMVLYEGVYRNIEPVTLSTQGVFTDTGKLVRLDDGRMLRR